MKKGVSLLQRTFGRNYRNFFNSCSNNFKFEIVYTSSLKISNGGLVTTDRLLINPINTVRKHTDTKTISKGTHFNTNSVSKINFATSQLAHNDKNIHVNGASPPRKKYSSALI